MSCLIYSQHFTCHWKLLVIYVMWLMFNKMADAGRSAAVIHTVPVEVPSESRTDETVVPFRTALDLQHQIVFQVLSLY